MNKSIQMLTPYNHKAIPLFIWHFGKNPSIIKGHKSNSVKFLWMDSSVQHIFKLMAAIGFLYITILFLWWFTLLICLM